MISYLLVGFNYTLCITGWGMRSWNHNFWSKLWCTAISVIGFYTLHMFSDLEHCIVARSSLLPFNKAQRCGQSIIVMDTITHSSFAGNISIQTHHMMYFQGFWWLYWMCKVATVGLLYSVHFVGTNYKIFAKVLLQCSKWSILFTS